MRTQTQTKESYLWQKATEVVQKTHYFNGCSLNLFHKTPNTGFMVSLQGTEQAFKNFQEFDQTSVNDYIHKHLLKLEQKKYNLGTWLNDNVIYIDISINIQDKNEALKFARENKQQAIFDLSNNESIFV